MDSLPASALIRNAKLFYNWARQHDPLLPSLASVAAVASFGGDVYIALLSARDGGQVGVRLKTRPGFNARLMTSTELAKLLHGAAPPTPTHTLQRELRDAIDMIVDRVAQLEGRGLDAGNAAGRSPYSGDGANVHKGNGGAYHSAAE
jgi:hypothetical protein